MDPTVADHGIGPVSPKAARIVSSIVKARINPEPKLLYGRRVTALEKRRRQSERLGWVETGLWPASSTVGRLGRGYFDGLQVYADGGFVDIADRAPPLPP